MNVSTPTLPRDVGTHRRAAWLRWTTLLLISLTTVAAYAGAIGLIGGGTDFGPTVNEKLPWQSPVLAGVALGLLVGVPLTVAGWHLWTRARDAWPLTAIGAGLWLLAWIVLQLLVIGAVHPLQAVIAGMDAVLLSLGVLAHRRIRPDSMD